MNLLSSQHLVSALRPGHPSHDVVRADPGPRSMKQTLASRFGQAIEPYTTGGVVLREDYQLAIKSLHTSAVADSIADLGINHVLGAPPPPINDSELALNRLERCTLAQLRSGDCHLMKDYQMRVGKSADALCPECLFRRHSVPHLFNCDAIPTVLNVSDLWSHPVAVIHHLKRLSSFSSIVDRGPPPPRPPPEPPP